MQIRNEKNDLERKGQEIQQSGDHIEREVNDLSNKIQRANQSRESKLNNVRAVRGQDFEQSAIYMQILAEVEQTKNKHLLNALS